MSIISRFAFSAGANIAKAVISFTVGMIVARGLGTEDYGTLSFLLGTFLSVMSIIDLSASNAFYTFICKSERCKNFYIMHASWLVVQLLISSLVICVVIPAETFSSLFFSESRNLVLTSFIAAFFQQQIWNFIAQVGEASRLTVRVQLINLCSFFVNLLLTLILNYYQLLSVSFVFYIVIIQYLFSLVVFYPLIIKRISFSSDVVFSYKDNLVDYFGYCKPLIPYTFLTFIYLFCDTWLLQYFSGSAQQALFSVGAKIAAVSLIATTSIVKILWKEIAHLNSSGQDEEMRILFYRTIKVLYLFSAIITGFLLPWVEDIILLVLGSEYQLAQYPLAIMLFYPMHQSIGQITGSTLLAIEKTKLYSIIGSLGMVVSCLVTYLVLADGRNGYIGLGLGAVGLALKMVVMQFFTVNVYLYLICKIRKWKFEFMFQFYAVIFVVLVGFLSNRAVGYITNNDIVQFVVSGFIYGVVCLIAIYRYSNILINVDDIGQYIKYRRNKE